MLQQECLFGPFSRGIWCQRRDSNSQTPVSKTGRYSNFAHAGTHLFEGSAANPGLLRPRQLLALPRRSHWLTLVHRGGFEPPCLTKEKPGLRPGRFSQTHAPVQSWRKVDESNAHSSSPCPGFQDQLPAIQQYLPRWRRVRESNPLASCESPCLADKRLTVRPTLRLYEGSATLCCCALANCSRDPALALAHL